MKKIRLLKIVFDLPISYREIDQFRGAIIQKVGQEHILYHNHDNNSPKNYRYDYPLIQYKTFGKNSNAGLICIEEGVEALHNLLAQQTWDIYINGEAKKLAIAALDLKYVTLACSEEMHNYKLYNWLALNQENFDTYQALDAIIDKMQFLEQLLGSHIISFAKGMHWQRQQHIKVTITNIPYPRNLVFKGINMLGFHVNFKCNALLPSFVGIGKGVSKGFGVIKKVPKPEKTERKKIAVTKTVQAQ